MNDRRQFSSRRRPRRHAVRLLHAGVFSVLLALLLAGCAAPPSADSFVTATAELRTAMHATGQAVESHLRTSEAGPERAAIFAERWQQRSSAFDAMDEYALTLDDIVAAGESGAESVRRISQSLEALADDLGIDSPPASAAESVLDLIQSIGTQISRVAAAQSLAEALEQSSDAVDGITSILSDDLADIDPILIALHADVRSDILAEYSTERSFLAEIIAQRRQLYSLGLHALSPEETQQLAELDALIEQARSWHEPMQQRLDEVEQTFTDSRELVRLARAALDAWQAAHHDLHAAITQQRPVDHTALSDITLQIRRIAGEGGRS
jgi:hypothetical protein